MENILQILGASVLSLGGAGAIILGLSKWFGNLFAKKLLAKDSAKYSLELEALKSNFQTELEAQKAFQNEKLEILRQKYQSELESTKIELEKSKILFLKYRENQFQIYNDLWQSLCDLKLKGADLWEVASKERLKSFSIQLKSTRESLEKNALLIEESHYKNLMSSLDDFENFEIGKQRLIELRNTDFDHLNEIGGGEDEIRYRISQNREVKNQFEKEMSKMAKYLRKQIKGE
ncbi:MULTISPECIES: hypothetical protein [Aquimarina]|uniref:hypothetical protein n=1 Tax=Aquimarina TaxID=290174 RepID=UPI00094282FF|nr:MULTISPECIES: hypothetical protein [Aquimarina]